MKNLLFSLFLLFGMLACTSNDKPDQQAAEATPTMKDANPSAEGFNAADSDPKAIELADQVMEAMGGRKQWDDLHYISWNFFGARDLVWDKWSGRVRIDSPKDSSIYLVNINTMEGRVQQNGKEVTDPTALQELLLKAKSIWINDSYWLVMPFKLKDSGVTLNYLRTDTTQTGAAADVIQLTFEKVGVTPDNKYEVYIDREEQLVKQWAFFKDAAQEAPDRVWPWDNYQDFNGLLLSTDRSDKGGPANVQVYDSLPDEVFASFAAPELKPVN